MIGIKAISSYIPEDFIDNIALASTFGESEDFIREKIGAISLPRKKREFETSDISLLAINTLLEKNPTLQKNNIDAIVLVTQNPDLEGLPHTSAILQNKLQAPIKIATFDISLGCSGYVYGLFVLKGFLESSRLKNGILITADPYSKILDQNDRITSLLFGDAATATWLGKDPLWKLGSVAYGTDGSGADYLKIVNKKLHMNGRQVFNFAATQVAPHIKDLLKKEKLQQEDIDMFFLHQGSAAIINAIAKNFPGVTERFVKDILSTGNTVSSSIPLILEKYAFSNKLNRILISGFGVGFSWATAILTK